MSAEQVRFLTGFSASPEFLKKVTYICLRHDPRINGIDTVRVGTLVMHLLPS